MANPENLYTGNGATVLYSFTFPYLEPTDVKVTINGVATTAYTLANATTVQFNAAPANGASIRIYRETDTSTVENTFFPGSSIRAGDLNDNFTKLLYGNQETQMITVNASSGNLADSSVTTAKLANSAVNTSKLADASVTDVKLATDSVTTVKVVDANITTAKVADNAITSVKLASGAVTSAKILDGTITSSDFSAGAVDTNALANSSITAAKLDSDLTTRVCRAWVNFNGNSNSGNLSGTYSQSGTTVTVTCTAHGYSVNQKVYVDATSGTGVDGTYTVATVPNANTFTYTAGTSLTTSGNCTLRRNAIRASYNVSSVADNGNGSYTVNLTTPLADANGSVVAGTYRTTSPSAPFQTEVYLSSATTVEVETTSTTGTSSDHTYIHLAVFR